MLNNRLTEEESELLRKRIKRFVKVGICCFLLYPLTDVRLMAAIFIKFAIEFVHANSDGATDRHGTFWLACALCHGLEKAILLLMMKLLPDQDDSARDAVARAIEAADAAGADPEKLRVAREVAASQALPGKADRFW